jgi:streptogramin lyase
MRYLVLFLAVVTAILMTGAVLAGANSLSLQETSLASFGEVYEVNLGANGLLYVSDYEAKQIWCFDPANLTASKYQLAINVSDARPDNAGNIWFTDGGPTFARLNPNTNQAESWDVPVTHNLQGLAFDLAGKLWMTEWINFESKIYRFDVNSTQLCTYTLPLDATHDGSSQSNYILADQNKLWIANRGEQRIYRIDPSLNQATWWQIPSSASRPVGIALDGQGNLWWADEGLNALASLNPNTSIMIRYNLPHAAAPKMLALNSGLVWYTASAIGTPGYLGALTPGQATGVTLPPLTTQTYSTTQECSPSWGAGTPLFVSASTPAVTWSTAAITPTLNTGGWEVHQMPNGSLPYGISLENQNLWISDQGRQKLMRLPLKSLVANKIFLPFVRR